MTSVLNFQLNLEEGQHSELGVGASKIGLWGSDDSTRESSSAACIRVKARKWVKSLFKP